uniref:tubulin epsilon and delta complex protein 2 n=1 Tax=Jaculus jaculus TaxID=51337 RepID=UPI001E1B1C30|nr:tubulin epsilon and delta complex protein 2 [Jaculus jaculus]
MLPAECARRLMAEIQGALDACSERQRQLERSLRVSRRLLRAWDVDPESWEPAGTPIPEPPPGSETKEEDPAPACAQSLQDLKELELLTQALEKAVRVRKGMSSARQRDRTPSLTSASTVATAGTTASAPSQASRQAGNRASARPTKGTHQAMDPAKNLPAHKLLSVRSKTPVGAGAGTTKHEPGLRDQQTTAPSAPPRTTEAFTLKEKGTLLQLPVAFRKAVSKNSRLWAQLSSMQTSDSTDATRAAKAQFLQKLQMVSGSSRPSAAEIEAEARSLRKACALLRLRMQEELSVAPADWMEEYRCLLTLEGLQAIVEQCLHRLQELQAAVMGGLPEPCAAGKATQASLPCGGKADLSWSPQLLLYSSTQELQTLATLKLRVAMLEQQIHLEKVLMAELLPLIRTWEPQGAPWLALCRAAYSLLCQGGERFLTILRDDPAD